MPLPALELKIPWAAWKAGPRRSMQHRARQTPVGDTEACFVRLLQRGAPCRCRRLVGWRALGRLEKLAHVARYENALSKPLWTARQRVLRAYCGKERHTAAGAWAEEPLSGSKSWSTF